VQNIIPDKVNMAALTGTATPEIFDSDLKSVHACQYMTDIASATGRSCTSDHSKQVITLN